jgi:hypothetical protein
MSTRLGFMGVHSIFNNISAIVLSFSRYLMKEIKVDEVNQHCFVNMSQTVSFGIFKHFLSQGWESTLNMSVLICAYYVCILVVKYNYRNS